MKLNLQNQDPPTYPPVKPFIHGTCYNPAKAFLSPTKALNAKPPVSKRLPTNGLGGMESQPITKHGVTPKTVLTVFGYS